MVADEKKEVNRTGGGSLPTLQKDPSNELALSLINEKTVYGLRNPFDSDSSVALPSCSTQDEIVLEMNNENCDVISDAEEVGDEVKLREEIEENADERENSEVRADKK